MKKDLLKTLKELKQNEGLTLKAYKAINHKKGYQVALEGKEAITPEEALKYIQEYQGTAGVWYSGGIYYIDYSIYIKNKQKAIETGKQHNQQSILNWYNMELIWLQEV